MDPGYNFNIHSNCLEQINKMREENDTLRDQLRSMNEIIDRRNDEIIQLITNNREAVTNRRMDPNLYSSKESFDRKLVQ
jgi:hypothetical protein